MAVGNSNRNRPSGLEGAINARLHSSLMIKQWSYRPAEPLRETAKTHPLHCQEGHHSCHTCTAKASTTLLTGHYLSTLASTTLNTPPSGQKRTALTHTASASCRARASSCTTLNKPDTTTHFLPSQLQAPLQRAIPPARPAHTRNLNSTVNTAHHTKTASTTAASLHVLQVLCQLLCLVCCVAHIGPGCQLLQVSTNLGRQILQTSNKGLQEVEARASGTQHAAAACQPCVAKRYLCTACVQLAALLLGWPPRHFKRCG